MLPRRRFNAAVQSQDAIVRNADNPPVTYNAWRSEHMILPGQTSAPSSSDVCTFPAKRQRFMHIHEQTARCTCTHGAKASMLLVASVAVLSTLFGCAPTTPAA